MDLGLHTVSFTKHWLSGICRVISGQWYGNFTNLGKQTAVSANFFTSLPVLSHLPLSTTQSTTAFTLKSTHILFNIKWSALTVDAVIALSKNFTRSSTCQAHQKHQLFLFYNLAARLAAHCPMESEEKTDKKYFKHFVKTSCSPSLKLTLLESRNIFSKNNIWT